MVSIFRKNNFFAVLIFCFVLIACGGSKERSSNLVVATLSSPVSLDPRIAVDAEGSKITALIFDGLFSLNEHMEIEPALAETYEIIGDTLYRFHLKRGIKFTNGSDLTTKDVLYTYESVMDPKTKSPFKAAFDPVKSIRALDDYTLEIELKEPYAPFLTALKLEIVSSEEASTPENKSESLPAGTGRYILKEFVPESKVVLEANPNYWGTKPLQKEIVFRIIKEDNVRVLKLLKGDVDMIQNGVPPLLVEKIKKESDLELKEDVGIVSTYMGLNLTDPILKNKKVRQAIAKAIDVDEIIRWRWRGLATRANSILAPDIWAYNENLPSIAYDPESAKKLLDEAGFPDPDGDGPNMRFELEYKTTTAKNRIDIARTIINQLNKVGIGVLLKTYEWGTFFRDVRSGNFQLYTLSWVGVTEPDIFYNVCHSSQIPPQGLNRDRYSSKKMDRLVELGRVTMDTAKRKEIYDEVQRILLDDLPLIPLWYEKNWLMYRKGLENLSLRPDASYLPFTNVVWKDETDNKK